MKRPKLSVVVPVVIVAASACAAAYLLLVPVDKSAAPSRSEEKIQKENAMAGSGSYVDYKDGVIAGTKGEKLLFFHAAWCPQCRAIEADIKDGGIPQNTTIIKVDYDNSQNLRQKYGVTIQTTIVRVDDNGNLVKKFVAYDEPTIAAVIKGTR